MGAMVVVAEALRVFAIDQDNYELLLSRCIKEDLGFKNETHKEVSIKKVGNAFDNRIDAKRTIREIKLLRHMEHENLIGSPDDTSLEFLRSDNACRYVRQLPQYPRQQFAARFPSMSPGAVDLIEKMLVLDPNRRITGYNNYRSFKGDHKSIRIFRFSWRLSSGVYNENPSLIFHSRYGFNPQVPYGPYSPVTTPLPSVGVDTQLYSPQQFPYTGPPYYHQVVPPSLPYLNSPTPVSQPELTNLVGIDQQVDNMFFGPRAGYPSVGSFGRGNFPVAPGSFGFHESQQGFEGSRSGGIWSDCSKPLERQRSLMPLSPSVSPQPMGSLGSFGPSVGMVCSIT
ncbi:hypothetical protein JHK85_017066 [Glycine max]|nr:hypothetical protein JHK85_017066 [Glycine max]